MVLGQSQGQGNWKALPLSVDQNTKNNPEEMDRIEKAHPGENVIQYGRVLGDLVASRAFGDVEFKWEMKYLKEVRYCPSIDYKTPTYITAEPVLSRHKFEDPDYSNRWTLGQSGKL